MGSHVGMPGDLTDPALFTVEGLFTMKASDGWLLPSNKRSKVEGTRRGRQAHPYTGSSSLRTKCKLFLRPQGSQRLGSPSCPFCLPSLHCGQREPSHFSASLGSWGPRCGVQVGGRDLVPGHLKDRQAAMCPLAKEDMPQSGEQC